MNKPARTIKQATIRAIARNLGNSYVGLGLTNGQLKAGARKLYDRHTHQKPEDAQFHWTNNNRNTPREE